VQTLTINVGAGKAFFLFRDTGANGPPDWIENAVLWNEPKNHSGDLYGVRSARVRDLMEPIYDRLNGRPYVGNVFPYDASVHNVVDVTRQRWLR
jgi:hypothetical protein